MRMRSAIRVCLRVCRAVPWWTRPLSSFACFDKNFRFRARPISCYAVISRLKLVDSRSFRRIFTDQVLYSKLCLRWAVFVAAGNRWFKYRKHQNSSVALVKATGQLQTALLAYLNWLEAYVRDHGFGHAIQKEVRAAR